MNYLGDFLEDETLYIPFNTFSSNDPSASVTITNLIDADIKVHKDGAVAEIVTDGATIAIDFDGIIGNHLITIDTSIDAAYSTGSDYLIRIEGTTVDAGTINAWVGHFSIENRFKDVNVVTVSGTAQTANDNGADINAILIDTDDLQTNQGNWLTVTGFATPTNITAGIITTVSGNVNGSVGSVSGSVTIDGTSVDLIWDEVLTKATHDVSNSSGKRLRNLASILIRADTAQGAGTGNNQIQLDTGASAIDGAYDPAIISIVDGTGAGQTRLVLEYNGASKTATIDRNWKVNPDATSEYVVIGDAGREHVNEGLVQAATATTITLNPLASSVDDAYNGQTIFIRSGTGDDQARLITDYVGATKVATIERAWGTNPDTTSAYVMLATALRTDQQVADAVWDDQRAGHTDVGTFGEGFSFVLEDTVSMSAGIIEGAAVTGTLSTTVATSDLTGYGDDQLIGRIITWLSGNCEGESSDITDYASVSGTITFTALTTAPANTDTFKIT